MKFFLCLSLVLCWLCHGELQPVKLIIDTDMSFDVDDVMAVCMANALMDMGEVEILAVMHDTGYPEGIGAVSAMNHWYKHDFIPLGAYKGPFGHSPHSKNWVTGKYVPDIVAHFAGPVTNYNQVPEAVQLYRQVLAQQADRSVVISAIGFETNIAALLQSKPDKHSPLNGSALVAQKVKQISWMGGWYPPLHPNGQQTYNFNCGGQFYDHQYCEGDSAIAVNTLPNTVVQVFTDLGDSIYTGAVLTDCAPASNPCRQAIIDQQGPHNGRSSWDPITTLLSIRGPQGVNSSLNPGKNFITKQGANFWTNETGTFDYYLYLDGSDDGHAERAAITKTINDLLCRPPKS